MEISQQLEALLFFKSEPVSVRFLSEALGVKEDEIKQGLNKLEESLVSRGIVLMQNGNDYMLGTSPAMGKTIEDILKKELDKDLGKAGLETLAIVLYRSPVPRSEINYIRGVNSNYILRSLLVRGLIEKVEQGGRTTVYRPTFELLSFMGIKKVNDLPQYEEITKAVEEFRALNKMKEQSENNHNIANEEN